jgi:uncharacterized membrane protein
MNALRRWWRHLWLDEHSLRRAIGKAALDRLEARVAAGERGHAGEIRLCIEAALPWAHLWRHVSPRARAVAMFSELRVWDTEQNNGVLIYLLLAEHAIEIVADRGLARRMSTAQWQAVMAPLQSALKRGAFEQGLGEAIDAVAAVLRAEFPLGDGARDENELPDRPHFV